MATPQLDDIEARMLALATAFYRYEGVRERAMRDLFDLSPTRFWQRVNALIDTPAAMAADPAGSRLLRSRRDRRSPWDRCRMSPATG